MDCPECTEYFHNIIANKMTPLSTECLEPENKFLVICFFILKKQIFFLPTFLDNSFKKVSHNN